MEKSNNIFTKGLLSLWVRCLRWRYSGILLETVELSLIVEAVKKFPACQFLVLGMGNDTPFWMHINRGGRTVFLENVEAWFDKMKEKIPKMEGYYVQYPNDITQWKSLLNSPERLKMTFPPDIQNISWDVILVDGPNGYKMVKEQPGRMSSIYMASELIKKGGIVFVHDCSRDVERIYSRKYLHDENFVCEVEGQDLLRKYQM